MKVSILISSYNGRNHTTQLLDSVKKLFLGSHELEVILRDDNSSDGTVDEVLKDYNWVRIITGSETVGFVKSNNIALRHATGDVICCVNQDTILDSHFLIEGLHVLETHPDVVGVNTNMIMPWVLSLEDFKKTPREKLPTYEYQFSRYGFAQYTKVDPIIRETDFVTGGGFFLRKSALMENEELFDSAIHMYCEDTELSLRLTKRGCKLMYTPKAVIYHNQRIKKAMSVGELNKLLKIIWNRFYVLSKHFSPMTIIKHYHMYLFGIISKFDYVGLPSSRKFFAYFVGICLTFPFFILLPFWVWRSYSNFRKL